MTDDEPSSDRRFAGGDERSLASGSYYDAIRIEVPPFAGLEPRLALTYDSMRGNGFVGVGWDVAGLSTIERAGPGEGAPEYGPDDVYLLDGEELVPCTALGGTHCTKIQRHLRIAYDGDVWHVWRKDGTKLTYTKAYGVSPGPDAAWGTPDDVAWKWALTSIVDTRGNTVSYAWGVNQFGCCWIYPDAIAYNGVTVSFRWEQRPDREMRGNGAGFETVHGRIKTIDVSVNGQRVGAYKLSYSVSARTGRSLLMTVQRFGKDAVLDFAGTVTGGSALPPVSVTLSDGTDAGTSRLVSSGGFSSGFWSDPTTTFLPGDFDGNGKTDFLALMRSDRKVEGIAPPLGHTFLSNADGTFTQVASGLVSKAYSADAYAEFLPGDFDGDGTTDFVVIQPRRSPTYDRGTTSARTFLANGDGSFQRVDCCAFTYGFVTDETTVFLPGDFNGDGRTDFVAIRPSWVWTDAYTYLSNGAGGFLEVPGFSSSLSTNSSTRFMTGDFDGDGNMDLIAVDPQSGKSAITMFLSNGNGTFALLPTKLVGGYPADQYTKFLRGDFNADGLADIVAVYPGPSTYVETFLSAGDGSFAQVASGLTAGPYADADTRFLAGDLNGDDRTDLVAIHPRSGTYAYTFLSNGDGTFRFTAMGGFSVGYWSNVDTVFVPGDFDGDAKTDFVAIQPSQGSTYIASTYANTLLANGGAGNLLARLDNGIGASVAISYSPSSAWANTNNPPITWNPTIITRADGNNGAATEMRSYAGGYYHRGEREARGFARVDVTGATGPNGEREQARYWFHQGVKDDPAAAAGYLTGKAWKKQVWDLKDSTYSETVVTYWEPSAAGAPYFAPVHEIARRHCRETSTGTSCGPDVVTSYATMSANGLPTLPYDTYGNLLTENQHGDSTTPDDDRTIVRTYATGGGYVVGLLASETVYAGIVLGLAASASRISETSYQYDGTSDPNCFPFGASTVPTRGNVTRTVRWLAGGVSPETWIGYDAKGNVTCVSDPDRRVTRLGYDPSGSHLTSVTNAKGHVTSTQYYGVDGVAADTGLSGQVKKVTDPNDGEVHFEYDAFGRMTVESRPPVAAPLAARPVPGFTRRTTYALGTTRSGNNKTTAVNRIETTDTSGFWTAIHFDGLGRTFLTRVRGTPNGRVIARQRQYNGTGTTWRVSLPYDETAQAVPRWTSFVHDGRGRVTAAVRADGTRTLRCFDDLERSSVTVDANNHRLRRIKDARGSLVAVQEYLGAHASCVTDVGTPYATTRYEYDRMNRLRAAIDAHGTHFETDYDTLGRKAFVSDPDLGTWYYAYTEAGDLKWQRDARGVVINYSFDELHRVVMKANPDGSSVVNEYDDPTVPYSKGRLTQMVDSTGSTRFLYDAVGRSWQTRQIIGDVSYAITTDYDAAGRMSATTYPDGNVVAYEYDADALLWKVNGATVTYATLTRYNALGQVGNILFGDGVSTDYTYNETGNNRLASIAAASSDGAILNLTFAYDSGRNVTAIADTVDPTQSQTFEYDELNRLTHATSQAYGALTYAYDEIGNLQWKEGVAYAYDPIRVHAVTGTSDGRAYQYDPNGNVISDGTRTFSYDHDNRPTSIRAGVSSTFFSYDGAGQRVRKTSSSGATIYVKKWFECTGGTCTRHVFAGDKRIASVTSDGTVRYYSADHLASTRVVTGRTGIGVPLKESVFYRPFGVAQVDTAPELSRHKFAGQELDAETGLYFLNARYYDPALGRFLSPDSRGRVRLHDPQSLNRYAYARNNPLRFSDPTGLEEEEEGEFDEVEPDDDDEYVTWEDSDEDGNEEWTENMCVGGCEEWEDEWSDFDDESDSGMYDAAGGDDLEEVPLAYGEIYDRVSPSNEVVGLVAEAGSLALGFRTLGTNLRLYAPTAPGRWGWGGNGAVRTFRVGNALRALGTGTLVLGVGLDIVGVLTGEISFGEFWLNQGVTVLAIVAGGWAGVAIGTVYFAVGTFYPEGWGGLARDAAGLAAEALAFTANQGEALYMAAHGGPAPWLALELSEVF